VYELRRPPRWTSTGALSVLPRGELQVPVLEQPLLLLAAANAFTLVCLDLKRSLATDVRKVSGDRAILRSSAGYFHHDLWDVPDRPRDLLDLRAAEPARHAWRYSTVAHDIEERRSIGW
jgi:hypothetical protein